MSLSRLPLLIFLFAYTSAGLCADSPASKRAPLSREIQQVLRKAKTATLYSLNPEDIFNLKHGDEVFHEAKVIGKMTLNRKQIIAVAQALQQAAARWDGHGSDLFEAYYGLRIDARGHRYDFVIFANWLNICRDNEIIQQLGVSDDEEVLLGLLDSAKVPIAF